jgi:hypothetical protein
MSDMPPVLRSAINASHIHGDEWRVGWDKRGDGISASLLGALVDTGGWDFALALSNLDREANEGFEGDLIALFDDEYLTRSGLVSVTADGDVNSS